MRTSPAPTAAALALRALLAPALAAVALPAAAFEAGVAVRDVTPPVGVPLGGFVKRRAAFPDLFGQHPYAHYFEPSTGVRQTPAGEPDAIRAKALALRENGEWLLFVSLDLVGIPRGLRASILAELDTRGVGIPHDRVLISATHTHSGPGTLSDVWLFEKFATDRFVPEIHDDFVEGVAEAVEAAVVVESAKLRSVSFPVPGVQRNRRPGGVYVDNEAHLLLVRTADESKHLGALVNFAVHGTVFGEDTEALLSADLPGAIEREVGSVLATLDGEPGGRRPVLFVNAAEGDVSPDVPAGTTLADLAAKFRAAAEAALAAGPLHDLGAGLSVAPPHTVELGAPMLYYDPNVPGWLKPLIWSRTGLWLGLFSFPRDATIWSVRLGDLRLMTWPGEPTSALGHCLREAAVAAGAREGWVLALTNDHLAYFTTPGEASAGDTAAKGSLYGPHAGSKLVSEHCKLMQGP